MSRFFFKGVTEPEPVRDTKPEERSEIAKALNALIEVQSITASAIFAKLVSKGVLTADEAAEYMSEIAQVLEIDVAAPAGASAANLLRSYGQALSAAEKDPG